VPGVGRCCTSAAARTNGHRHSTIKARSASAGAAAAMAAGPHTTKHLEMGAGQPKLCETARRQQLLPQEQQQQQQRSGMSKWFKSLRLGRHRKSVSGVSQAHCSNRLQDLQKLPPTAAAAGSVVHPPSPNLQGPLPPCDTASVAGIAAWDAVDGADGGRGSGWQSCSSSPLQHDQIQAALHQQLPCRRPVQDTAT